MSKYTEKQNQDWIKLCDYIKKSILGYTSEMKFPKYLALRLKGLSEGNFIANKHCEPQASYSFEQILITSKLVKPKVQNYFNHNSAKIKDERHKINLIMLFIEQEINDVVLRLQNKKDNEKKFETMDFDNVFCNNTNYVARNEDKTKKENNRLEKLW